MSTIKANKLAHLSSLSLAYPLGVFGVACTQFAIDFDSPAFRVISTAICILSVIYWIFLAVYTLPLLELLLHEAVQEEEESQHEHVNRRRTSEASPGGTERSSQA
jgi:fatty acid desaturase